MTPRILLTGKNGQLGHDLEALLPRLGKVVALDRQQLDLSQPGEICRVVREIHPDLIVNAAAYTGVDLAEKEESLAAAINALAPAIIAEEAKRIGAAVVHYSTDYVFDGSKNSPYEEGDRTNPLNVYGRTKLAGEQAIRDSGAHHLIFRTAWVYSTRGKNFLLTILRLATERDELRIVNDQFGAPTWSREIASASVQVLQRILDRKENSSAWVELGGTYHMTAAGVTTWFEFARAILGAARTQADIPSSCFAAVTGGKPLVARNVVPINTSDYPTPAHRPAYSVLSNARLAQVFGIKLADWRAQLRRACADERINLPY
ncbi:MAG: dTDP-4-dehydrorhamnose reductase [Candidatus Acidiferrales bacterium]